MRVGVIGASGQLGSEIIEVFGEKAIPILHEDLEVRDIKNARRVLKDMDIVINCAAYVKVDESEDHKDEAFGVNGTGAMNVAIACKENKIKNMYISTDFVFDGSKKRPYQEDDTPNPINAYGLSKYAGEVLTRNYCEDFYIVRSSSLYGRQGARGKGGNFVDWMIEKAKSDEAIEVVNDIVMSPTYAVDAAEMIKSIIGKELPYGVYHVANQGHCTWFDFTKEIFKFLSIEANLSPIKSGKLDRKAKRPKFSAIKSTKLDEHGLTMRSWEEALRDYLTRYRKES